MWAGRGGAAGQQVQMWASVGWLVGERNDAHREVSVVKRRANSNNPSYPYRYSGVLATTNPTGSL